MCGRYVRQQEAETLSALFEATAGDDISTPSWNISPKQQIAVVVETPEGRQIESAFWSLVPKSSTPKDIKFTFNARKESALISEKTGRPSLWSTPLKNARRCLIPASGFYEWTGPKNARVPNYIYLEDDLLAFAGLYSWWRAADSDPWMLTATMFTMPSVPELASIHDRNPVALPSSQWKTWLDREQPGDQSLVDMMIVASEPVLSTLKSYTVAPLRGDTPDLITPA